MAGSDSQEDQGQERKPNSFANEEGKVIIQGECHNPINGLVYAVSFVFSPSETNDLSSFPDMLSGVSELSGLECSVSLRSTSSNAAWDGDHRI